jgi:hypothetical protein
VTTAESSFYELSQAGPSNCSFTIVSTACQWVVALTSIPVSD